MKKGTPVRTGDTLVHIAFYVVRTGNVFTECNILFMKGCHHESADYPTCVQCIAETAHRVP
jgi:hypothetical protein